MGKALTGELSFPCDRSCYYQYRIRQQMETDEYVTYAVLNIQWAFNSRWPLGYGKPLPFYFVSWQVKKTP